MVFFTIHKSKWIQSKSLTGSFSWKCNIHPLFCIHKLQMIWNSITLHCKTSSFPQNRTISAPKLNFKVANQTKYLLHPSLNLDTTVPCSVFQRKNHSFSILWRNKLSNFNIASILRIFYFLFSWRILTYRNAQICITSQFKLCTQPRKSSFTW